MAAIRSVVLTIAPGGLRQEWLADVDDDDDDDDDRNKAASSDHPLI